MNQETCFRRLKVVVFLGWFEAVLFVILTIMAAARQSPVEFVGFALSAGVWTWAALVWTKDFDMEKPQ